MRDPEYNNISKFFTKPVKNPDIKGSRILWNLDGIIVRVFYPGLTWTEVRYPGRESVGTTNKHVILSRGEGSILLSLSINLERFMIHSFDK